MSDSMAAAARGIHQAQAEYLESLASAALASGMEEIHVLRDKARELYGPGQAHRVKDLRNAANRDEYGEECVDVDNKTRVDLARVIYDHVDEVKSRMDEIEKLLSKLIHGK